MLQKKLAFLLFLSLISIASFAQQAVINGLVKDDQNKPVDHATVAVEGTDIGTVTNNKGYYTLQVPADKNVRVAITFIGYETQHKNLHLNAGENRTLDIVLKLQSNTLTEFVKKDDRVRNEAGGMKLDASKVAEMPTVGNGVEDIIKTYVGSHNELTSQYSVRGGSYDENLVYVNDFEIYRPFLIRSGQQEGLSFINPDLTQNVYFSVGGFQAKYGDKMSSVLDVTYKRPEEFGGSVMLSLLGAQLHLEGASKNKKLSYLIGARQKSNQYLLQSQPTKGVYNPSFTDIQALLNYRFNSRWEMEIIANYARNRFSFYPESETVAFGLVNQAYQLTAVDSGSEIDQFDSKFGGLSITYRANERLKLKFLTSVYQTHEQETYDISETYLFGELQTDQSKKDFGQIKTYLGTGGIQDFARNYLDVTVANFNLNGTYNGGRHFLQFGAGTSITSINDDLHEWERRDSAAYTQPYNQNALYMTYFYNSAATFNYALINGYIQDNYRPSDSSGFTASVGLRYNYSTLNSESIFSPRVQLAYKPESWKQDVVFRFATGVYAQPAFYREMRDMEGNVNKALLAQKSYHVLLGMDYDFKVANRPFKVTAEGYYKYLWDIDPYVYDNVRIRYTGKNDAVGYVYGGEVRLYGDLVKDATSWISVGIMKGVQRLTDSTNLYSGYFPLPSDQRVNFGMYLEDYLPRNKNFKVHLNMIYATGLPFTSPYGHIWDNAFRAPDYKRVDIGFSALLLDAARRHRPAHSFFNGIKSVWASLEVFNLLGIQNTLSYTWIQDQTSGDTFAVPNRLTSRLLNAKIIFRF